MAAVEDSSELSKEVPGQDLQLKYEKLASEYAKIKAQVIVLKKAVIEEQNKTSELKQTIRSQEQVLRKNEQEMESLVFRNHQLSKRVTILQDDLEEEKKSVKKGGKKNEVSSIDTSLLDEDFKRLVQENAKLHTRIQDIEDECHLKINALNETMSIVNKALFESRQECKTADAKYQPIISKLEREKTEKDAKLRSLENIADQMKSLQTRYDLLEQSFKQIEYFANTLSKHFSLDGLNSMKLNNVSLSYVAEAIIINCIVDIITALTSFFCQLSNRLTYLTVFGSSFQSTFKYIQRLSEQGKIIIDKYIKRNTLDVASIVDYNKLLDNLLDNLKPLNRTLHATLPANLLDFVDHLIRIFNVLPILFLERNKIYISNSALVRIISELVIFEQLSKMLKSIFQNETEAECKSNAKKIQELTSVNDCFIESLTTLENSIQILAVNLTQLLLGLIQWSDKQTTHDAILDFSKKASQYIVNQLEHTEFNTSQKYQVQAEELNQLKDIHCKQLQELHSKIENLEQQKISIQNDYDILIKKTNASLSEEEKHLAEYFRNKLYVLVEEKQKAEGKATMMTNECVALHRRLEFLADSDHQLNELVLKWKQYAAQLKDELQITADNYEIQLNTMSEHLKELHLDLESKRYSIEQLTAEIKNKKIKGKS